MREREEWALVAAGGEFFALALLFRGIFGDEGGLLFGREQGADDVNDARGVEDVDDTAWILGRDFYGSVGGAGGGATDESGMVKPPRFISFAT